MFKSATGSASTESTEDSWLGESRWRRFTQPFMIGKFAPLFAIAAVALVVGLVNVSWDETHRNLLDFRAGAIFAFCLFFALFELGCQALSRSPLAPNFKKAAVIAVTYVVVALYLGAAAVVRLMFGYN